MRNTYRSVLLDFAGNDSIIAPQFKTWFYIYKPNTARDEFKKILIDNYLVEIKDIEKFDFDFGSSRVDQYSESSNTKPVDETLEFDDLDTLKIDDLDTTVKDANADYDQIDKTEKSKVSKFDKEVDDKQYVEKSEIPTEAYKEEETTLKSMIDEVESGPEKFILPIRKFVEDSMEIMEAQENKNFVNGVI